MGKVNLSYSACVLGRMNHNFVRAASVRLSACWICEARKLENCIENYKKVKNDNIILTLQRRGPVGGCANGMPKNSSTYDVTPARKSYLDERRDSTVATIGDSSL